MTEADLIAAAKLFEDERGAESFADLWLDIFTAFEQRTGLFMPGEPDEDEVEFVSVH